MDRSALNQPTFAELEYKNKKRKTRREVFLEQLDSLIPWQRLEQRIRPHYPKAGRGRRPYDLAVMLRVHIVQLCHNLSDPAMEDLLYEAESVRRFVGLRLSEEIPDESTILHFRHLLERHNLGQGLFAEIQDHLAGQGMRLREGTIVDATIIAAPSSTKNRTGQRDPEMRQVKKGNQYHFGMKLHIGTDAETGLVHSFTTTSANVHDVTEAHNLLHGEERQVWGDAGYTGVQKRPENLGLSVQWQVAMKPGQRRQLEAGSVAAIEEKVKASIRAKSLPPTAIGGGTPLPEGQAAVRLWQGALSGSEQEYGTVGNAAGAGQPADGPKLARRLTQGAVGPKLARSPKSGSVRAE